MLYWKKRKFGFFFITARRKNGTNRPMAVIQLTNGKGNVPVSIAHVFVQNSADSPRHWRFVTWLCVNSNILSNVMIWNQRVANLLQLSFTRRHLKGPVDLCLQGGVPYNQACTFLHHTKYIRLKYALLISSFGLKHNQIGIDGYFEVATKNIWIFLYFLRKVNSFTIIIIHLLARPLT